MTRPDSIRALGLKKYLNQTADKHGNQTYADFARYMTMPARPATTALARVFKVSRPTMEKWILIYKSEQKS